jgi:tetratricopeptide (TPR) repeat protein
LGLAESQQTIAEVFAGSNIGMGAVVPYISPDEEERSVDTKVVDAADPLDESFRSSHLSEPEKDAAAKQEQRLREILGTAYNDLGTAEAKQKEFVQAAAHFREAERWNPEIPGLTRNLGLAAAKVNDHETVVRTLSKQLQTEPQDQVARALLGLSLFMTDRFAEAADTIAPFGETAARDPALAYPLAASFARIGKIREAAAVLDRAEQEPVPPVTRLLFAQLWNTLGSTERALEDFRRAAQIDPTLLSAHYQAGLILLKAGRPEEARQEFEAELKLNPADREAQYNLGFAYLQQSRVDEARALFAQIIASDPKHANAQYQLGKILLDKGDVKEAITHLQAAATLTPDVDYIHYQLQAAYRKDDRLVDAERELQLYKQAKSRNREKQNPIPNPENPSNDSN